MQDIDEAALRKPEELAEKISKALAPDLRVFTPTDGRNPYTQVTLREIDDHLAQVTGVIRSIVDEWESMMGEDDKSLYSLGLRHAIDIIYGRNPTTKRQ
jgi:hypothetical protein